MKILSFALVRLPLLGAAVMILSPSLAKAQTSYYWEPGTPANDGTLNGGAGTWNSTNAFFTTSLTDSGTAIAWPNGVSPNTKNTVIFGGAAGGTVTLSTLTAFTPTGGTTTTTAHLLNNLTFATSGYTLAGSNFTRFIYNGTTNGSITVNSGISATINSVLSGATTGGVSTGTADGNISTNVLINGGGTLNMGGANASMGWTIDAATTVQVSAGSFSGFNLNTINNGSILRPTANGVLVAPSSYTNTAGTATLDLNGTTQTISSIGGNLAVTHSTATANRVLSLSLTGNALTHTGVISDGTGKLSLATVGIGTLGMGNNFSSTHTFVDQTLAGANTYTGSTSHGRGRIILDFSNAAAPATNILYNAGFGTPTGDDGKLVIMRSVGTIGVANSAWGSLAVLTLTGKASTTNSQQFNGLKLEANSAANIFINPNATANTVTLNLGSTLERAAGSLLTIATTNATTALSASAAIQSTAGTASTVLKDANGVAYAVIGGREWAAKNAANTTIVAATTTPSTPTAFTANADIATPTVGAAANDTRLSANTTISSLTFANSTARSGIHLGGNTLTTGGILTSVALTSTGSFISGGTVMSPGASGSDIVLVSNVTSVFGLDAVLANGLAATGFTKGGTGIVAQTENNTFTGLLNVHSGGLIVRGSNTASGINISGSTTSLMGAHLPPATATNGAFLQIGYGDTSGSLGSGDINIGTSAILAIKRSDNLTLSNNILGTGGITQAWSGITTLVSATTAKYTYVGDTTVTAGTLKLDYAASNTSILSDSTKLFLGGGTVEYATVAGTTHNDAVREFALLSGASTITKTGTGTGRLRLNAINDLGVAGSTLNFTAPGIADSDNNVTNGIMGSRARLTVGTEGVYDWAVAGGSDTAITAFASYGTLDLTAGTDATNPLQVLIATTTFTGSRTTNTLKLTNSSGSSQILDIAAGNTLTLTAGGLLVTGANEVQINNGTLRSNSATTSDLIIHQYNGGGLTINSVIANGVGNSTLTKSGNGTLTLGNTNTYTGQTYLNGGTTVISANANLGAVATGAALNLNNATLRVTADVILSNGVVGTNDRTVNLHGLGGTFEVDATRTLTIGGGFSGAGGLTKTGAGTLDLRAAANITGPTTVTAGTLRFGAAANPVRTDITVGASGTMDIFGFANFIGSLAGSGAVTNTGAAATLTIGGTHVDTTFSGQITNGTSALNLDKAGAGILTLTGASNNYTGSTTVSGGTLTIFGSGVLPTSTVLNVSSATGTFDISGVSATGLTVGSLANVSGSSIVLGAKNLSSGGLNTSTTIAGVISGTGGSLTKNGTGALTLSGANTYTGGTTITSTGSVTVSNANGLGTGPVNIQTTHTGATVSLTVSSGINVANAINIDSTTGRSMIAGASGSNTLSGPMVVTGASNNSIVIQNSGVAGTTFSLTNTITSASYTGIFSLRGTTGAFGSISNTINAPSAVLQVNGDANWIVSGTGNNYSYTNLAGATGSFILGATDALDTTGRIEWSTAATNTSRVDMAGFNQTVGGLTSPTSTATTHGVTNSGSSDSLLTLSGLSVDRNFTGVISDGSTNKVAVTLSGTSFTQTFGGTVANTYTGDTTVNGSTLALAKTAGVNAIAGNLTIGDGTGTDVVKLQASNQIANTSVVSLVGTVNGSRGVFRLNGYNETIGGLSGDGVVEHNDTDTGVGSSTSNLTLNVASGTQTQSAGGVIRNTGATSTGILALTKDGAGTQVLGGTNTYTGTTTVTAGALQVGSAGVGQTGSGAVTVQTGATLLGSGTVRGTSFTADSGSTLHAGDSTAASSFGTLNFTPVTSGGTQSLQGGIILGIGTANNLGSIDPLFGGNDVGTLGYVAYVNDVSRSQGLGAGGHDLLSFNNPTGGGSTSLNFLTTTGSLQILGSGFTAQKGQIFNLLDWAGLVTANFTGFDQGTNYRDGSGDTGSAFDLPSLSGGLVWDVSQFTTSGVVVVVPEPSRAFLIIFGFAGLMLRRRRF